MTDTESAGARTETYTVLHTGTEVEQCLQNLRYVPASHVGGPTWLLQQAWRVSVIDKEGKNIGGRIEWRDVPYVSNPSAQ